MYKTEECLICGCMHGLHEEEDVDFNKYGIFHYLVPGTYGRNPDPGCAEYVYNDLRTFMKLPKVEPADADYDILNAILGVVSTMKSHNKASALISAIHKQKIMDGSANVVHLVLGVLSMCGILQTETEKGYLYSFKNSGERNFEMDNDLYYPLVCWKGKNGADRNAMTEIFGSFAKDRLNAKKEIPSDLSSVLMDTEPKKKKSKAQQYFKEEEYMVDLTDRYRYYYGLTPILEKWDKEVSYSSVHCLHKKVTLFFEGDVIKKYILEEINNTPNEEMYHEMYQECDLDVPTKGRKILIPKTTRGSEKPLRPSDLMNPTYMCAHLTVLFGKERGGVTSFNSSNDQELPLPPRAPKNKNEFEEYTEKYIASCPPNYDQTLDQFLHRKRASGEIRPGDIFRIRVTPTLYTYFLIMGRVYDIWECPGIPDKHPIYRQMAQPIAYRQYAILTDNANVTAKELEKYPLLVADIAQDNFVYWGTYPIVDHKELTLSDVEFGFLAGSDSGSILRGDVEKLYWGLAECELAGFPKLVEELTDWRRRNPERVCPFSYGTGMEIVANNAIWDKDLTKLKIPNTEIYEEQQKYFEEGKKLIIKHLQLDPENPYDDFVTKFGGVSRKQLADFLNNMEWKKKK